MQGFYVSVALRSPYLIKLSTKCKHIPVSRGLYLS